MSAGTTTNLCTCVYPFFSYPGKCCKCNLSVRYAEEMRIMATNIPYRFYLNGDLTWAQHEVLAEKIDHIVFATYNYMKSRFAMVGETSLLCFFQESILGQVRALFRNQHNLELLEGDETAFRMFKLQEKMSQLSIDA